MSAISGRSTDELEQLDIEAQQKLRDTAALFPDALVDSELGEIPGGWSIRTLQDLCVKITDGAHASPKSVDNGRPMASVKDMHNWGIDIDSCRQISEEDYENLVRNNCRPLKDDVLIAKDGSYLKHIFMVEDDMDIVLLSSIAILKPNTDIVPYYLALMLGSASVMK